MTKTFKNSDMDMEFNIGQMVPTMKANGFSTKLKVREHSGTLRVMFTAENSKMTWLTVMVNTLILTAQSTKENLRMTFKKVMAKKSGLMEPSMLDRTRTA